MEYSLESTTAEHIIAFGRRKKCRQVQKIVLEEDTLQKSFPRLPGPLAEILKSGNMTKRAAAATVNCMR